MKTSLILDLHQLFHLKSPSESRRWVPEAAKALTHAASLVRDVIDELLRDDELARAVSRKSHIHLNGFAKVVLAQDSHETMQQVRLHIWRTSRDKPAHSPGDIHDHRWPFVSLPLLGAFFEERFVTANAGMDVYAYHCNGKRPA